MARKEINIEFLNPTTFEGSKGIEVCTGIKIIQQGGFIDFYPLNKTKIVGAANIKIPIDNLSILDKLINGLILIKDNRLVEIKPTK